MSRLGLLLLAPAVLPGAAPLAGIDLAVSGLRSTRGTVQICLTSEASHFPNCTGDPTARHVAIAADRAIALRLDDLPAGTYAIAVFHDENDNGRVDTRFGVPTEGIGFSNNPHLWFGPPSFAQARFTLTDQRRAETVKIKYFL